MAKQGSVNGAWTTEWATGASKIAVASDPTNGPLIAVFNGSSVYAKEGSMTGATWTEETTAGLVSVASDATNGLLIGVSPGLIRRST